MCDVTQIQCDPAGKIHKDTNSQHPGRDTLLHYGISIGLTLNNSLIQKDRPIKSRTLFSNFTPTSLSVRGMMKLHQVLT